MPEYLATLNIGVIGRSEEQRAQCPLRDHSSARRFAWNVESDAWFSTPATRAAAMRCRFTWHAPVSGF
ncbi:MAG: hypothetical protein AB7G13_24105 [Lautropia sp.]